jgi:hypothetical protein
MSKVQLAGNASGTGIFTIASPNSNTDRTLTLPDNTGTLVTNTAGSVSQAMLASNVAGTGPAFQAYQSTLQSFSSNTVTKVLFQTEEYDTNSNFASSRFTPTVAGYYQFSAGVKVVANGWFELFIYKNGVNGKTIFYSWPSSVQLATGGCQLYMNGTTDYVEVYLRQANSTDTSPSQAETYFAGVLVRAA